MSRKEELLEQGFEVYCGPTNTCPALKVEDGSGRITSTECDGVAVLTTDEAVTLYDMLGEKIRNRKLSDKIRELGAKIRNRKLSDKIRELGAKIRNCKLSA
ncbi:hypothetical protein [Seinonella peptonophila]|uniref:hypothetical protein n=1 Tax=Seinonella peptonophila TaxID=112248 RepID=UPI001114B677|nr:hypothetical protein [Seinonella peptonophila]